MKNVFTVNRVFFGLVAFLMISIFVTLIIRDIARANDPGFQQIPAITKTRQYFFVVNCNQNFAIMGPFKDAKDCEAIRIWAKKASAGYFDKDISPMWYIDKY